MLCVCVYGNISAFHMRGAHPMHRQLQLVAQSNGALLQSHGSPHRQVLCLGLQETQRID